MNTVVSLGFTSADRMSAYKDGPIYPELIIYRKFVTNPYKNKDGLKSRALNSMLVISFSSIQGSWNPG